MAQRTVAAQETLTSQMTELRMEVAGLSSKVAGLSTKVDNEVQESKEERDEQRKMNATLLQLIATSIQAKTSASA